jgi:alkylhydroperoxidase family enzyme
VTLDEAEAACLKEDYTRGAWSPADRAMLDYVARLTRDATRLGPADLDGLRAAGFDDRAILQITGIASWFNAVNRTADALGVGRPTAP